MPDEERRASHRRHRHRHRVGRAIRWPRAYTASGPALDQCQLDGVGVLRVYRTANPASPPRRHARCSVADKPPLVINQSCAQQPAPRPLRHRPPAVSGLRTRPRRRVLSQVGRKPGLDTGTITARPRRQRRTPPDQRRPSSSDHQRRKTPGPGPMPVAERWSLTGGGRQVAGIAPVAGDHEFSRVRFWRC